MSHFHSHRGSSARQRGATLIIGLVLLLVMSILAISTMNSSTFGLAMVGNMQYAETAFQMAETGVEVAIDSGPFNPSGTPPIPETAIEDLDGVEIGTYASATDFQLCGGMPAGASTSISSEETYSSYHFEITSTGTAERGSTSQHIQDFSLLGPGCL